MGNWIFAFFSMSSTAGISISCKRMPGHAVMNAAPINAFHVRGDSVPARSSHFAHPLTALPASIATAMEPYIRAGKGAFLNKWQNISPHTAPYVHSSAHIETPVGNITGITKVRDDISGVTRPTAAPYCHPHTIPHMKTGMCIGRSAFPAAGPNT